jgi:acyl-CoA hydrolase
VASQAPAGAAPREVPDEPLTDDELAVAERIRPHLHRGALVAFADGAGAPVGLGRPLAHAARQVGGVRLLLGWSFRLPVPLDPEAFPDVRAIVGGYGLRRRFGGHVHYVPARLSAVPALLQSVLRPDVLLAGLRPSAGGLVFGSEVGWARAAVDAGARVLAEVNTGLPAASLEPPLREVTVVAETHRPPLTLPLPAADPVSDAIGKAVAGLVPAGASVQFGPGGVGDAALRALEVPVHVDSGIVGDAVVGLEARGLLAGPPLATYLAGTSAVYEWADGRPMIARVEHTHDPRRLSDTTLLAINTALEIDEVGQVNVEGFAGDVIAGVGGHPDFAGAAVRSADGLSVVALPTVRGGRRTLVERLGAPTSTTRSDVDVVVTELGVADLRGLDDGERRRALRAVWA